MADSNPYAPPGAQGPPITEPAPVGVSDYRHEQRPVILCIVLTFVTFGLYPAIWFLRRRAFLNSLNASKTLSPVLPSASIGLSVLALVFAFAGKEGGPFETFLDGIAAIVLVIASFRVASMLSSDFARTGRLLSVSYGATFFFGIFYLQYKMNRAASVPARMPKA
jgi:hypothetical protein